MGMIRNPKEVSKHGKKDVKLEMSLLRRVVVFEENFFP
jgi:hypothetical protein